ncbi:MAG: hypothetical protein Kow0060_04790 [Methylohalobius crimeensis]
MNPAAVSFTPLTLRMLSGALIWAFHFGVLYLFTALACARGFSAMNWHGIGVVAWVIGAATLAAVSSVMVITVRSIRYIRNHTAPENALRFMLWMTAAIGGLSLVAIVWQAVPVLLIPACG